MPEVSAHVMQQLEQAQAALALQSAAAGPPVEEAAMMQQMQPATVGAAGSGDVQHVLVDHYFTSATRRLYVYSGGAWRNRAITDAQEQGIAQVAFLATRVQAWWDASDVISILRCWKTF